MKFPVSRIQKTAMAIVLGWHHGAVAVAFVTDVDGLGVEFFLGEGTWDAFQELEKP